MPTKRSKFIPSRAAELEFNRALRGVAKVSGHIVEMHVGGIDTPQGFAQMQEALKFYSKTIEPWARRQSEKMLAKVSRSNKTAYEKAANQKLAKQNARLISKAITEANLSDPSTLRVASTLMHEQVALIQSIPLRAGERVQKLAREALISGQRYDELAEEILATTDVSEADATRIARTEVARSNAAFTQARAQAVGSQGYIWRTTMDGAERHSHAKMNGKYVEYAKEPTLVDGTKGHAGTFPNCRCYQDVQFSD